MGGEKYYYLLRKNANIRRKRWTFSLYLGGNNIIFGKSRLGQICTPEPTPFKDFFDNFFPRPYLNEQVLELEHTRILDSAIQEFDAR